MKFLIIFMLFSFNARALKDDSISPYNQIVEVEDIPIIEVSKSEYMELKELYPDAEEVAIVAACAKALNYNRFCLLGL